MRRVAFDLGLEFVTLVVYAFVTVLLEIAGVRAELAAVNELAAGHLGVGLWLLFVGALGLFVATFVLGYGQLLPGIRHFRGRLAATR